MTTEYLGEQDTSRGTVPVFVVWCDFTDRPMTAQIVHPMPCPRCQSPLNIGPLFADQRYASIAVNCNNCGAQTHFDRTPVEDRRNLGWLKGFKRD